MLYAFAKRVMTEVDGRLLWRLMVNLSFRCMLSMHRFNRQRKRGEVFPPVLFISITSRCNLSCQGCWVTPGDDDSATMSPAMLNRIITQAKRRGNYFFGLLGGEPLLHKELWDVVERHRDCYFQVLTNGTLITDQVASRMRRAGNVTPLISIEGDQFVSDVRRGGTEVFGRTMEGLAHCRRHRLMIGAATSVCKSNIDALVCEEYLRELVARGVHYVWYYIYRPVGPRPAPELALSAEQITQLRRFLVDARQWAPLMIIDAYWDHLGRGQCPAAMGVSHHVNHAGDIEPCPPIQFSCDRVDGDLYSQLHESTFLAEFRKMAADAGRGCILMDRPDLLRDFVLEHNARDSSGRATALAELEAMGVCPSHAMAGHEIPERSWLYRFAKKNWFFGFGAYG